MQPVTLQSVPPVYHEPAAYSTRDPAAASSAATHANDATGLDPRPPHKRPRSGYWSDQEGAVFAAAGAVFGEASPPGSSDDEQAMDLLVRLWSPSSGSEHEHNLMTQLQASNGTSPSTTSPQPEDSGTPDLSHPAHATPVLPANIANLPVAHAWPLPAHLQPHSWPPWPQQPPRRRQRTGAPAAAPPYYRHPIGPPPTHPPHMVASGHAPPPPAPPPPGAYAHAPAPAGYPMPPSGYMHPAGPPRMALGVPPPPRPNGHPPPPSLGHYPHAPPAHVPPPPRAPPRMTVQWHPLLAEHPQPERRAATSATHAAAPATAARPMHPTTAMPLAVAAPATAAPADRSARRVARRSAEGIKSEAVPAPPAAEPPRPTPLTHYHHQQQPPAPAEPYHLDPYQNELVVYDDARPSLPPPHEPAPTASTMAYEMPYDETLAAAPAHALALAPAAASLGVSASVNVSVRTVCPSMASSSQMVVRAGGVTGFDGSSGGALLSSSSQISMALGGGSGRNLAERKEWTNEEDRQICRSVRKHGFKWRLVAADVPGRSDDAVRNRYNRVKDLSHVQPTAEELEAEGLEGALVKPVGRRRKPAGEGAKGRAAATKDSSSNHSSDEEKEKVERISWSRAEDETIVRSVRELGNKWAKIAERLPGRTEHAIRNRYARLQSLALRGNPIMLSSGQGLPIGISLVPGGL